MKHFLYRIRDVWDYLDALAQVLAFPLRSNDVQVDPACGDVVLLGHGSVDKALIVANVHVAFATVICDKHFAVSNRVHGAGVVVDVRVNLNA